jgi:hypothetical protein
VIGPVSNILFKLHKRDPSAFIDLPWIGEDETVVGTQENMIELPLRHAAPKGETVLDGPDFLEGDRESEFNLKPLPGAPLDR